jgi:catechol-2,3-dioxygenase
VKTTGLCELTLETAAPRSLAAFYQRVLDLPTLSEEEDRIWLGCGENARLGLWSRGPKEFGDRGGRHVHFAFSIERGKLRSVRERLADLGVEHTGPVEHPGGDHSLYFADPEGNLVEVWDFFEDGDGAEEGVGALDGG